MNKISLKIVSIVLLVAFFLVACNESKNEESTSQSDTEIEEGKLANTEPSENGNVAQIEPNGKSTDQTTNQSKDIKYPKPQFKNEQDALLYDIKQIQTKLQSDLIELRNNLQDATGKSKLGIEKQIKKVEKINTDLEKNVGMIKNNTYGDWDRFKAKCMAKLEKISESLEAIEEIESSF